MQKVIDNWRLNKGVLASKMEMVLGTFCNKLNPNHSTTFTPKEVVKLKLVLKGLAQDLESVSEIEFNEALENIIN